MRKLTRPIAAGLLACTTVFMGLVFGLAHLAGATNIDVEAHSFCNSQHRWEVDLGATNTHNAPLVIQNNNSTEPIGTTLAAAGHPGDAVLWQIFPGGSTFAYTWSTSNGILIGKISDTLHRPEGCTVPDTTTTTPATTVPTTVPETTAVPTTVPATVDSTVVDMTVPTTAPREGAPVDVPLGPPKAAVTTVPHALPATGSSDAVPFAATAGVLLVCGILLLASRRIHV